jgi:hypothetical protein
VRNALVVAAEQAFQSVALPLIGSGTGGVAPSIALTITESEVRSSSFAGRVVIVIYDGT